MNTLQHTLSGLYFAALVALVLLAGCATARQDRSAAEPTATQPTTDEIETRAGRRR